MNHFAAAVDALDAAVFNGDGLLDVGNRDRFKQSLERWQRKLAEWEEIAADLDQPDAVGATGEQAPAKAIQERGPWTVGREEATDVAKRVFLQSGDFNHDARVYVSGDFTDDAQRVRYAQEIARRLNARAAAAKGGSY